MRHVFIVNPVSGKTDAWARMRPAIERAAAACGVRAELLRTERPKHATQLARAAAQAPGPVRLYAVGGDGTLNEVLAGAWEAPDAEVACVPCGSGNDYIRSFGPPESFLDLEAQINGRAVPVDLMAVDGGVCAAITSAGMDAEVAWKIPRYRRIPLLGGTMAYSISIAERLLHPMGRRMRVTLDGESFGEVLLIAAVCNGKAYGGGYCAAPMASLRDGMLDIILVKKIGRLRAAGILGKYKLGQHWNGAAIIPEYSDVMSYHRAREVEIRPLDAPEFILNVDGECGPAPRLYARVMPGAARFVLPANLDADAALR